MATYEITEVRTLVREGFSSRAVTCVEREGFEEVVSGYRITKNGQKIFTAYPPFKTVEEAQARISQLVAAQ